MFGGGFWGAPGGGEDHLTLERDPPPRPVELEFPAYIPDFKPQPLTSELSSQIRHKICHARSFLDISDADIQSLNVCLTQDVSISSLLPDDQFTSRPLLFDADLQAMLDEISIENDDAFREVLRLTPLPGHKKPRLAYARNFFSSLEDMARYFDDSKDDYYHVPINANDKTDTVKDTVKDTLATNSDKDVEMLDASREGPTRNDNKTKEVYKGYRISSAEMLSPGTRLAMLKNLLKTTMHKFQCRDHEPVPQPREKLIVRGVKIQSIQYQFCVARIPHDMKMARSRHVEGPIIAVASRDELRFKNKSGLHNPDRVPFLGERFDLFREIGCMLILAAQRAREGKEPLTNDEEKWWVSKHRWGGGPTRWGQLAPEVYEDEDPSWSPSERKLQEEKRQRQADERAIGVDKDAAIDPKALAVDDLIADNGSRDTHKVTVLPSIRAGSPVTTAGALTRPSDLDIRPKKKKFRSMDRPADDDIETRDGRRLLYTAPFKRKWYREWQRLCPNTPTIDQKVISKRIGVTDDDEFDEVYMLTSVNHHVALLKMKVHSDYLAWLESGRSVSDTEINGFQKCALYVNRTTWFDMLKVKDRKDFLIGLWRVFCWINRDHIPSEEFEKMKDLEQQQQQQQ